MYFGLAMKNASQANTSGTKANVTASPVKYIAISKYGWGMSKDKAKAVKSCKSNAPHGKRSGEIKIYSAHPEVAMFGDGSWEYPQAHKPKLVETLA